MKKAGLRRLFSLSLALQGYLRGTTTGRGTTITRRG